MQEKEIWKDIDGYEGFYQVSNLGRVKSLIRPYCIAEKILKPFLANGGYYRLFIYKKGSKKLIFVHQLIAIAFLNHKPNGNTIVVDHIDFNRLNNNISNLRLITNRENTNQKHLPSLSKHIGVGWESRIKKWRARIHLNKKRIHLGYFTDEYEAHLAYQEALKIRI